MSGRQGRAGLRKPKDRGQNSISVMHGAMFSRALQLTRSGDSASAEKVCREIVAQDPRHADSLHHLGVLFYQQHRFDEAAEMMARSIAVDGGRASFHSNYGLVLQAQGRLPEALSAYQRALTLCPGSAEAQNNLGNVLHMQGNLEEAMLRYREAIRLRPGYVDAHCNLGAVMKAQGKLEEAVEQYRRALLLHPGNAEAYYNLGNTLSAQAKVEEAIACYNRALALRPAHAKARMNLGLALQTQGRLDEALVQYREALRLEPDSVATYCNLGAILEEQGKQEEAVAQYRTALSLRPGQPEIHQHLGEVLGFQGLSEQAIEHYKGALEEKPLFPEVYVNWGSLLVGQNAIDEAISMYDRAIELWNAMGKPEMRPEYVSAQMNAGMAHLVNGNFVAGLEAYEWRHRDKQVGKQYSGLPQPLWKGEPLGGARILLHAEQGLGDTLQFLRYVPAVQAAGGEVALHIPLCLHRLAGQLAGVTVVGVNEPLPPFDVYCPFLSLLKAFGTTLDSIPAEVPYLFIPDEERQRAQARAWPVSGLRVGVVWAGSAGHKKDKQRSLSMVRMASLLAVEGVHFFSLQAGPSSPPVSDLRLGDLQLDLDNMADTAAKMTHLDLVIAVDTAVAHLAGALGIPVWVLLPFAPDWRWLLEREDSPWYPTMRLFRQPRLGDWESVLGRVRGALLDLRDDPSAAWRTGRAATAG